MLEKIYLKMNPSLRTLRNVFIISFLFISFQLITSCKEDSNSMKIDVDGIVVDKDTHQPITDVLIAFTSSAGYTSTLSQEDGFFAMQNFRSKTAVLTLEKEGYIFEYKAEDSDSVQNSITYSEGTYEDVTLEMRKLTDN